MLSRINPNKERFIQGKRIFFSFTKLVVIRDYRVRSIGQRVFQLFYSEKKHARKYRGKGEIICNTIYS